MRLATGRFLGTVLVGLTLAGASACGQATPPAAVGPTTPVDPTTPTAAAATAGAGASAGSTAPAGTRDPKTAPACDAVTKARRTALDALVPVAAALGRGGLSRDDLAKATNDLNAVYTAMHLGVAGAADLTVDPQLKAKISAYQLAVEHAIVAVEGSDGEQAKLKAVIELPALRSAEKAVMAACT
ncbi:hypothetical protein [Catellatospora sichuanensis]|uniref:hypothetical protein n=1 Tax=Catellatospora sichuanensis TaxID=1969805 RepID=UPI0016431DBE|nr:hypothetical protein [Catellatospora sichuanensis]